MLLSKKISEEELLAKIKQDLPTLSGVVTYLLNIVLDDKSSMRDISKAIEVDQALVSKVMRVVNSAAYGLPEKISTLNHALTILGIDTLKRLLLSISVFDNLSSEDQVGFFFNKSHFWCHSLAVAVVARDIALFRKYECPNEAYVAGLLHDVGKIIMERVMVEQYRNYLKNLNLKPTMSLRFEEENLSINHATVGKLSFEKWSFPKTLQKAIELHHGTENDNRAIPELAAIVSVADFICWTQALGSFDFFSPPTLNPQIEKIINLKDLNIEPILEAMNKELDLNTKAFNLQTADSKSFRECLQRANLELGRINSLYDNAGKNLERHIHELNMLNSIIYKVRKILEPSQIIQNVLQGIREGFGFMRLIWFSIDPQKEMIIPKEICGEFQNSLPIITIGCGWDEEISFPMYNCVQNKKIFHMRADEEDNVTSNLHLLKTLQSKELLLVPISAGEMITDLLLIDNLEGSVSFSPDTIKVLEILALNLGMCLENAKLFQQTAQLAIIDSLTNVYNRRQLDFLLNNEINRAVRFHQSFSIAIFDIDYFKLINDNYGHQAGDNALKDVAGIIKNNAREIDAVGRFGGDEFLVILPNTTLLNAVTFSERVRLIMERYGLLRQKKFPKCRITTSIGLAGFVDFLDTTERLINKADKALYQSKQTGRNRVSVFKD